MYTYIYDSPDKVTEAELKRDLLVLPQWRRNKALAYHNLVDRVQSVKVFLLLRQCLDERYGTHEIPPFEYGKYGKPFLKDTHFNLSHCRKGVICVADDFPVGCDIEAIPENIDFDLLTVCFNEKEQEAIIRAKYPNVEFVRQWTRKEALLKLIGIGLTDGLQHIFEYISTKDIILNTVTEVSKGYVYTTAQYTNNYLKTIEL